MTYEWNDAKYTTRKAFNEAVAQSWIRHVSELVEKGCAQWEDALGEISAFTITDDCWTVWCLSQHRGADSNLLHEAFQKAIENGRIPKTSRKQPSKRGRPQ